MTRTKSRSKANDNAKTFSKDEIKQTGGDTSADALFSRSTGRSDSLVPETVTVGRLMPQEDAANILGVSPKWLERDRWVEKRIPFVKIGRLVRYRAADITAYIEANIQGAA